MTTNGLVPGPNGLPKIRITTPDGSCAEVYAHGAHVTSWIPANDEERLYLSTASQFRDGAAIRGGVPVVFPQFSGWGPLPKHGFVRNRAWELASAAAGAARFQLRDSDSSRAIWPHAFFIECSTTLRERELVLEMTVINSNAEPFTFTAALHTYLRVADIADTAITGLANARFFDAAHQDAAHQDAAHQDAPHKQEAVQSDAVLRFSGEVDRVYYDTSRVTVDDGRRSLEVQNYGFSDCVIWNPGETLAATLHDLEPGGYQRFVCVEAAIFKKPVTLAPQAMWRGGQVLRVPA